MILTQGLAALSRRYIHTSLQNASCVPLVVLVALGGQGDTYASIAGIDSRDVGRYLSLPLAEALAVLVANTRVGTVNVFDDVCPGGRRSRHQVGHDRVVLRNSQALLVIQGLQPTDLVAESVWLHRRLHVLHHGRLHTEPRLFGERALAANDYHHEDHHHAGKHWR